MRFNTDKALFDAFPSARDHVRVEPAGASPLAFLQMLARAEKFDEALSFCAYLLARREAVTWACRCLRGQGCDDGASDLDANPALKAAETWAASPSEDRRRAAYACWTTADRADPAAWFALGAAWSGGSVMPDLPASPPAAPHLTASVVRVGIVMLLHGTRRDSKSAMARQWLAEGARLAEAGP